jgi:hypothetical protein
MSNIFYESTILNSFHPSVTFIYEATGESWEDIQRTGYRIGVRYDMVRLDSFVSSTRQAYQTFPLLC